MAVVGPDGYVLDTLSLVYSPRNIPKVRTRSSRFMTRLPYNVRSGRLCEWHTATTTMSSKWATKRSSAGTASPCPASKADVAHPARSFI